MRILVALLMALWGLVAFTIVELVVFLPLFLLGIPLAWWAAGHADTRMGPSRIWPARMVKVYVNPILNWWIGNDEDGITTEGFPSPFRWFLRNPVTNLRFTPALSLLPDPERVRFVGAEAIPPDGVPGWFIAWQGPYVGFRWQNRAWGIWAGWKINLRDAQGVPADDYRRFGIGTALQLMRF